MSEIRKYAYVQFLAAGMVNTSIVAKAERMAEEALASFDKRFPNGEDREVVDAREEIGRLQQKIVEYSNQIIDLEADKKRVGGDLSSVIEQRDALDVRIAALTAERDAAREELARQGDGVKGEP